MLCKERTSSTTAFKLKGNRSMKRLCHYIMTAVALLVLAVRAHGSEVVFSPLLTSHIQYSEMDFQDEAFESGRSAVGSIARLNYLIGSPKTKAVVPTQKARVKTQYRRLESTPEPKPSALLNSKYSLYSPHAPPSLFAV